MLHAGMLICDLIRFEWPTSAVIAEKGATCTMHNDAVLCLFYLTLAFRAHSYSRSRNTVNTVALMPHTAFLALMEWTVPYRALNLFI